MSFSSTMWKLWNRKGAVGAGGRRELALSSRLNEEGCEVRMGMDGTGSHSGVL